MTFSEWDGLEVMEDAFAAPREEDDAPARPRTRGECENTARPCPYVTCRHHLLIDVSEQGNILLNEGDPCRRMGSRAVSRAAPESFDQRALRRLAELPHTCSLDVADEGPHTLEQVGEFMGVRKERAYRVEERAIARASSNEGLRTMIRRRKAT